MSRSGIYAIENLANGKRYYGSTRSFRLRKNSHWCYLRNNRHPNEHLQRAWNLYGEEHFRFCIVCDCPVEQLLEVEDTYISINRDGYNVSTSAVGHAVSPETRAKISATLTGRKMSAEAVAKFKARTFSPETRAQISAALKGRKRPPEVIARIMATKRSRYGYKGSPKPKTRWPRSYRGPLSPELRQHLSAVMKAKHQHPQTTNAVSPREIGGS